MLISVLPRMNSRCIVRRFDFPKSSYCYPDLFKKKKKNYMNILKPHEQSKPSIFNSTGCSTGKLGIFMENLPFVRFYPILLSLKTYLPSQLKAK